MANCTDTTWTTENIDANGIRITMTKISKVAYYLDFPIYKFQFSDGIVTKLKMVTSTLKGWPYLRKGGLDITQLCKPKETSLCKHKQESWNIESQCFQSHTLNIVVGQCTQLFQNQQEATVP
jgi:hypothetical protein